MRTKIYYDNLYVAFPVYDHEVETEQYEQYETFGTIEHRININQRKKLIYSVIDENGNEKFYDYETRKEVVEHTYSCSFSSQSSAYKSLYCGYINGYFPIGITRLREEFIAKHEEKKRCVGYFIPFTDYIQEQLGIDTNSISLPLANSILHLMNVGKNKSFILSTDSTEAKQQLSKMGYHIETKEKSIK